MSRFSARRLLPVAALGLLLTLGPGGSVASAKPPPPRSYCATAFCTEVAGTKASQISLELGTFNFTASHRVCVNPPRGKTVCRRLSLTRGALALYHGDVYWADKFPHRGRGIYRVRWTQDGVQLGPVLGFRLGR